MNNEETPQAAEHMEDGHAGDVGAADDQPQEQTPAEGDAPAQDGADEAAPAQEGDAPESGDQPAGDSEGGEE